MRVSRRLITVVLCLAAAAASARAAPRVQGEDAEAISLPAPGELLVIGEVHGTKEIPAAFVELVDRMLERATAVSVGLEMPADAGAAGCKHEGSSPPLGAFWRRRTQDGRSSQAMREMVCSLKRRAAEGRVRLVYVESLPRNYDEMAQRVSVELASKSRPMMILIGNFHARNTPSSLVDRIRAKGVKLTSLTASSPDATPWNCSRDGCGARPMEMNFCPGKPTARYLLVRAPAGSRWDGCMVFPRLTSSPPAIAGAVSR